MKVLRVLGWVFIAVFVLLFSSALMFHACVEGFHQRSAWENFLSICLWIVLALLFLRCRAFGLRN